MAKMIYLERQFAMVQALRWHKIHNVLDSEAKKPNPRSLQDVIQELETHWEDGFNMITKTYQRKPKYKPLRCV